MKPINHLYSIYEPCDVASSVRTWIDSPQAAPWLLIEASPDATHGAGIFAYKTELLGLDKYSSTMGCIWDHHPASNSRFFSNRLFRHFVCGKTRFWGRVCHRPHPPQVGPSRSIEDSGSKRRGGFTGVPQHLRKPQETSWNETWVIKPDVLVDSRFDTMLAFSNLTQAGAREETPSGNGRRWRDRLMNRFALHPDKTKL
jgi:hypothetical protein